MSHISQTMPRLHRLAAGIEGQHDLAAYAAHAAILILLENWSAALRDGETLKNLTNDLLDVAALLRQFHDDALSGRDDIDE